jgi:glycosyltransferase involved in cell wall biosynthesis
VHDRWLARAWHRVRLPIPIELALGRLDLFHSPDFTLPPTLPGTSTLLTVHDLSFVRDPASASPALKRYLDQAVPRSVSRATHVLADSRSTRDDLIELYSTSPEKGEVLYSGVEARFAPAGTGQAQAVRAKYGLGDGPFVLSVGTIHPRKNHVRLMQAFARLDPSTGEGYRLVIAGGREWSSDAVLAASIYEGFGLPVLEAMACGVPVLASTASCLPEVAGDAAVLVDPYDVDGLAAALQRLLTDDNLRNSLVARGRARAAEFTWQRAARQLMEVYGRISAPQ